MNKKLIVGREQGVSMLLILVLLGFLISYILFFVRPVFLSEAHSMQFYGYVPAINPIGVDLGEIINYSESWFIYERTPYIGANLYPPFASVLFTPLLSVDRFTAYKIITIINVFCYLFLMLIFPLWMNKKRKFSAWLMLFLITGLFSYGFQFELERGQFNVIAIALCFLAIGLRHSNRRYRWLAWLLFSISVQLKLYPAIFIIMFITDWRDWKSIIKEFLGLGIFNFALFFVLGPQVFLDFVRTVSTQGLNPYVWIGNHSIHSFIMLHLRDWPWLAACKNLAEVILLAGVAAIVLLLMVQAYWQNQRGINPYLLLACAIGALLIPSISHDYKLPILASPVALIFSDNNLAEKCSARLRLVFYPLIFIFSLAYSSTLFSYITKPSFLGNNLPALIVMLLITILFSLVSRPGFEARKRLETTVIV